MFGEEGEKKQEGRERAGEGEKEEDEEVGKKEEEEGEYPPAVK